MSPRPPGLSHPLDDDYEPGPGPGPDLPRWPKAPENTPTATTYFTCSATACGQESTLSFRCSECGAEPRGGKA